MNLRIKFIEFMAVRFLSTRRDEKLLSVISIVSFITIAISVAAVIIVISIMQGFHRELTKNIVGVNGDVTIATRTHIDNGDSFTDFLKSKHDFIDNITPMIYSQAFITNKGNGSGVFIKGADMKNLLNKETLKLNILAGDIEDYNNVNAIAIGSDLASRIGVNIGTDVDVIIPKFLPTFLGIMPRIISYRVAVIFSSNVYEYDAATILTNRENIHKPMGFGADAVNMLEIDTNNFDKSDEYAFVIENSLNEYFIDIRKNKENSTYYNHNKSIKENIDDNKNMVDEDSVKNVENSEGVENQVMSDPKSINLESDDVMLYESKSYNHITQNNILNDIFVSNWKRNNQQFLSALAMERSVMWIILSIIILVATFNVFTNVFMLVNARMRDIAILYMMGTTKTQVLLIFIMAGLIISFIGVGVGSIIGGILAENVDIIRQWIESFFDIQIFDPNIYLFTNLNTKVDLGTIYFIGFFTIFLSLIASIYPAYRASRFNPVEILRHE